MCIRDREEAADVGEDVDGAVDLAAVVHDDDAGAVPGGHRRHVRVALQAPYVVDDRRAGVVVMHNRHAVDGSIDILADIRRFFLRSLLLAERAGIPERRIVLDPGIGFGKTLEQNVETIARLSELRAIGLPILVGASRKSLIGRLLDQPLAERMPGTLATHVLSVAGGADIIRAHDVREHAQALRIADVILAGGAHR